MSRRLVVVFAAALTTACGVGAKSGSGNSGGSDDGPHNLPGGVPIAALLPTTTTLKVVLNRTTLVDTPVTVDDGMGNFFPVSCSVDSDCAVYGGTCKNLVCTTASLVTSLFYAKNLTATASTFPVPCNGDQYTAEIYGAGDASGGVYTIQEIHLSVPFTMGTGCTTSPADVWTNGPAPTLPSMTIPTIYQTGLGAPYETYTVPVGLRYPWATASGTWSVTNPGAPISTTAASATFGAPTGTSAITFTGTFHLDHTLLLATEAPNAWQWTESLPNNPVVGIGTVSFP